MKKGQSSILKDNRIEYRVPWWEGFEALLMEGDLAIGTRAAIISDWLPDDAEQYCWRCGAGSPIESVTDLGCSFCVDENVPWDHVLRLGAYEMPMTRWIAQMKFTGAWGWADWLGRLLAEQLEWKVKENHLSEAWLNPSEVGVCHVPLHWRRKWERGYDQAGLMGKPIAERLGCEHLNWLKRHKATERQSKLMPEARRKNIRHAFEAKVTQVQVETSGIRRVILVDDVKTTGATAKACIQVLRSLGVQEVMLAVAAVRNPKTIFLEDDPYLDRRLRELSL